MKIVNRIGDLVTTRFLAKYYKLSMTTIWRWKRKGRIIPKYKLDNKTYLFDLNEIKKAIESKEK